MAASLVRTCIGISSLRQNIKNVFWKDSSSIHTSKVLFLAGTQCRCYRITSVYLKRKTNAEEKMKEDVLNIPKKKKLPIINIRNNMTVKELAHAAQRSVDDVLLALSFASGVSYSNQNTVIESLPILQDVVKKLGAKCVYAQNIEKKTNVEEADEDVERRPPADPSVLVKRHPVVTIMGHVDHGKTTLLDALRHTSVVDTEFGGITQHIGAFNVTLTSGERVTFLDTPGHAAFSAMRARGAQVTDIVVLVVAANDGVMEQTVQSIEMAQAAKVPIVVAINKIDLPTANIERTQKMLAQKGILVEELGGDVLSVNISALENINLDVLMDTIATQAELLNLKGDPTGLVEAVVIECTNDVGRGKLATVLVQRGTLRKGAVLVSGTAWAKVRGMFDHSGVPVSDAKLSEAVQTIGWRELPFVGEEILEVENEKRANAVIKFRKAQEGLIKAKEHKEAADKKYREYLNEYKEHLSKKTHSTRYRPMKGIPNSMKEKGSDTPKVNVIIKADVIGSVEAILDVLNTYSEDEKCCLSVVHYGVGNVTETDIELAETFNAVIYPFNVSTSKKLLDVVKGRNINLRPYNVIYRLIDDIKEEITNKLSQITVDDIIGEASVLQAFEITEKKKKVNVAGCRCIKGNLKKSALYRLVRNGEVIFTGKLVSMRHLKNEVNTIKTDMECGLRFEDATVSFQPGDTIICFLTRVERAQLQWHPGF